MNLYDNWLQLAGRHKSQTKAVSNKIGRNKPSHCGSGKKYKKCCCRA